MTTQNKHQNTKEGTDQQLNREKEGWNKGKSKDFAGELWNDKSVRMREIDFERQKQNCKQTQTLNSNILLIHKRVVF